MQWPGENLPMSEQAVKREQLKVADNRRRFGR